MSRILGCQGSQGGDGRTHSAHRQEPVEWVWMTTRFVYAPPFWAGMGCTYIYGGWLPIDTSRLSSQACVGTNHDGLLREKRVALEVVGRGGLTEP